ncbi:MAG TPA: hypothetical protein VNI79_01365 [Sphingomicrobium sp.]|nr:hypothetical protein [Sphingomicrobium sp.]
MRIIGLAAMALSLSALPLSSVASAQNRNVLNQQGGLVNVNVTNVDLLTNFANGNTVDIELLRNANISVAAPITIQAPISVAATVCGVAVNVLARGGPSNAVCTATSGSEALTDLALRTVQSR